MRNAGSGCYLSHIRLNCKSAKVIIREYAYIGIGIGIGISIINNMSINSSINSSINTNI